MNLYGATKLCAEKLFVQANVYAGTHDTALRLRALRQRRRHRAAASSRSSATSRNTGELTVTDERMTRFWITLDQAVQFVADCVVAMSGGEVFVPKIPSTRVLDLAEAIAPGVPDQLHRHPTRRKAARVR